MPVGLVEEDAVVEVEEAGAGVTVVEAAAPALVSTPSQLEHSVHWSRDQVVGVKTVSMNRSVVRFVTQ